MPFQFAILTTAVTGPPRPGGGPSCTPDWACIANAAPSGGETSTSTKIGPFLGREPIVRLTAAIRFRRPSKAMVERYGASDHDPAGIACGARGSFKEQIASPPGNLRRSSVGDSFAA